MTANSDTPVDDAIRVNDQGVAQFTAMASTLVREMLCAEANDMELAFFAGYCRRLGLDPFSGHVNLVKRRQKRPEGWVEVARPELSVAGLLLLAERSGKYKGRTDYQWCGADGLWVDVWLESAPPAAARVGVLRKGSTTPVTGVATWASYAATKRDGALTAMWKQHGPRMLGKCALALALREAMPADLGGAYSQEELQHTHMAGDDDGGEVEAIEPPERVEVVAEADVVAAVAARARELPDAAREVLRSWMRDEAIPAQGMTVEQLARLVERVALAEGNAAAQVPA